MSSIAFSMMNKVNVQVANRIHKHARINHELVYRIQENLEHTHSFAEVFMTNINKYLKSYTSQVSTLDEHILVESTFMHELAEDICKTRTLFQESSHDMLQYIHKLVDALIP